MDEQNPTLKELARELAESELIARMTNRIGFGHIVIQIQNKNVVTVKIEETFR